MFPPRNGIELLNSRENLSRIGSSALGLKSTWMITAFIRDVAEGENSFFLAGDDTEWCRFCPGRFRRAEFSLSRHAL